MADETVVRDWLKALGALCAGSIPEFEANARLSAYANLLQSSWDDWVFNRQSLMHVAETVKFFPSFSEVNDGLRSWAKEHSPPAKPAIAGPDGSSWERLTAEERGNVTVWQRHEEQRILSKTELVQRLNVLRNHLPHAFNYLVKTNEAAAIIARHKRWETHDPRRDWSDPTIVQRAIASLDSHPQRPFLGRMLSALIQRHAPQNLPMLPPEFQEVSQKQNSQLAVIP